MSDAADVIMVDSNVHAMNRNSHFGPGRISDHVKGNSLRKTSASPKKERKQMSQHSSDIGFGREESSSPSGTIPEEKRPKTPPAKHHRKRSSLSSDHVQTLNGKSFTVSSPKDQRKVSSPSSHHKSAPFENQKAHAASPSSLPLSNPPSVHRVASAASHSPPKDAAPFEKRKPRAASPLRDAPFDIRAARPSQPQSPNKSSNTLYKASLSPGQTRKQMSNSSPTKTPTQPSTLPAKIRKPSMGESPSKLSKTAPQTQATTAESIKHDKEVARLKEVLLETSTAAAQQVLREEWRTLLFDSHQEDHLSFILRAILKNSKDKPRIITSALNDKTTLEAVLENAATIPKLLGSCSLEQLLEHAPKELLDQAFAESLKNRELIDSESLVRWLAEAERLGYKKSDLIALDDESVSPNMTPKEVEALEARARPYLHLPAPDTSRDPLLAEQERNLAEQQRNLLRRQRVLGQTQSTPPGPCPRCGATFPTYNGYAYHGARVNCFPESVGGWKQECENCKQKFTTNGGYDYHTKKDCCGMNSDAPLTFRQEKFTPKQSPQVPPLGSFPPPAEGFHPAIRPPMKMGAPPKPELTPPVPRPNYAPPHPSDFGKQRFPSELTTLELASLEEDLQEASNNYDRLVDEINRRFADDEDARNKKLKSAKDGFQTKKSQIRKRRGVTLRMRKSDQAERRKTQEGSMVVPTPPAPTMSFSPVNKPGSASKSSPAVAAPPPPDFRSSVPSYLAHMEPGQRQPVHVSPYSQDARPYSTYAKEKVPAVASSSQSQTSSKKRRSDEEDHESPRPNGPTQNSRSPWLTNPQSRTVSAPGLQMMEMRSEDAAKKYKTKKSAGGASIPRPPMSVAAPGSSSKGVKDVIVLTDSDSETDNEPARPAPIPRSAPEDLAPSIEKDDDMEMEDAEEEGA